MKTFRVSMTNPAREITIGIAIGTKSKKRVFKQRYRDGVDFGIAILPGRFGLYFWAEWPEWK